MPVVLLHGGGQTKYSWKNTQRSLASEGFLAIAVDLRGHGLSEWSANGRYDLESYAADVRAVGAACHAPPILVGASLGGISSVLAIGEPPGLQTSGLVLVDVASRMTRAGNEAILAFMLETIEGFASVDEAAVAVASYLPHRPRPKSSEGLKKNLRQDADGRYRWHWDPRAFNNTFDPEAMDLRLEAAAFLIDVPSLLLRGANSELVSPEAAETFMARFADGHVQEIGGAFHMVAGDRNDAFSTSLIDFCRSRRDAQGFG
jgi:pimeloyl-ACP methyl ester carboxylesterase